MDDLEERFEGFNETTRAFKCIYDLLSLSDAEILESSNMLAESYGMNARELFDQLTHLRAIAHAKKMEFENFANFAKWILKKTQESALPLVHKLVAIILVLPFSTADCERSFSAMNKIKTPTRNKLKDILNDLMILYDLTPKEKESINILKLAEKVAGTWNYDKVDKTAVNEAYAMSIV